MFEQFKKKIEEPLAKTIILGFNVASSSILTSIFTTEITIDGKLEWKHFYSTISFYFLLGAWGITYLYLRFIYQSETSIKKFEDDEYCKAYMRKECLPEAAKRANRLIKSGKNSGEIRDILNDLHI